MIKSLKLKKKIKISSFESYIIRKPLFPFNTLLDGNKTNDLNDLLDIFLHNDQFLASVYWSSPSTYETILKLNKGTLSHEKIRKALSTLKKYLVRSATRCTPYGTWAGTTIQRFDYTSSIETSIITARIDSELNYKLTKKIESDSNVQRLLRYRINPSVYELSKKYRYLALEDNEYHLNSLYKTDMIDTVFKQIGSQFHSLDEIVNFLPREFTYRELSDFVIELAEIDFLQSEISPLLYSENAGSLVDFLDKNKDDHQCNGYKEIISELLECQSAVHNSKSFMMPYREINAVKEKLLEAGISQTNLFQLDLLQNSKNVKLMNTSLLNQVEEAINFLNNVDFSVSKNRDLTEFKKVFNLRYESREQRLADVLDPETGVGFPTFSGIGIHHHPDFLDRITDTPQKEPVQDSWANINLINIIEENISANNIDLGSYLSDEIPPEQSLPATFYALGNIVDDHTFFLQNVGGASAKTLFSRFTHLHDDIKELYQEIAAFERDAQSDTIIADIIFLPNDQVGNVTRPQNHAQFEISIAGENPNADYHIRISDLYISVVNDEIILRSKELNKRIIPLLSNAHNFANTSTSIYNFISSLQNEKNKQLGIEIDQFKSRKRYIPRITYKNIILRRATWMFFDTELSQIHNSDNALDSVKELFSKWNVPQFIVLAVGDNELFIDSHNNTYLQMLLGEISKLSSLQLIEWIYKPNFKSLEYVNQIILPFKNHDYIKPTYSSDIAQNDRVDSYIPGDQWLFYKIYCHSVFSDELLRDHLLPLLNGFLIKNEVTKGFFIRFSDPHYHIRFRLHASQDILISDMMHTIYHHLNPLVKSGEIWKIELATYEPETERYGAEYLDSVETCFTYDSLLISTLLDYEVFTEDVQFRVLLCVKNLHYWLVLFDLNNKEKLEFCEKVMSQFEKEFTKKEKTNIYSEFRNLSDSLHNVMTDTSTDCIFLERNEKLKRSGLRKENVTDLVHMSVNRWFPAQQRLYEYIIYIFAWKYYKRIIINSSL